MPESLSKGQQSTKGKEMRSKRGAGVFTENVADDGHKILIESHRRPVRDIVVTISNEPDPFYL